MLFVIENFSLHFVLIILPVRGKNVAGGRSRLE